MLGIAVAWHSGIAMLPIVALLCVALFVMLFGLLRIAPKWLFGVGALFVMFSAGAFVECCSRGEKAQRWSDEKSLYEAQLLEVPSCKGNSVGVLADVKLLDSASLPMGRKRGDVYLYFTRSIESDALSVGDIIRFEGSVLPPHNAGNPAEFDVEKHYYIKGISGSAFVDDGKWRQWEKGELTLAMRALMLRERVVRLYEQLGPDTNSVALLSALTVGEKRDFPRELKESYTAAGASHVLALSGLHLGILYLLLTILLPLRGRRRVVVVVRELLVVSVLWCFVFVAGATPSVVRAAILFTLISLGRCLQQESSSLSSLAFAAIVMLLFAPHLLFDVSFQLSFAAVFSIVLLAPELQMLLGVERHGRLYGYVANLLILPFVAQIGTLPILWYHFGVLPLYSLLTNILVVPLAFVVIALALPVLGLALLPVLQQPLSSVLFWVVGFMNDGVSFISSLPGASVALPQIGVAGALLVALLLWLVVYGIAVRRWWLVGVVAGCVAVLCVVKVVAPQPDEELDGVIIYNNRKNPLLHIVSPSGENWLLSTVPQLDAEYEYSSLPFVKREGLPNPVWIDGDYATGLFVFDDGLLHYKGVKVRLLSDDLWRENIYAEPTDVVLLCRGFLGSIKELCEVYPFSCLVLDASLYARSRSRILRECEFLDIVPVDISAIGAVKIVPQGDDFAAIPLKGR